MSKAENQLKFQQHSMPDGALALQLLLNWNYRVETIQPDVTTEK